MMIFDARPGVQDAKGRHKIRKGKGHIHRVIHGFTYAKGPSFHYVIIDGKRQYLDTLKAPYVDRERWVLFEVMDDQGQADIQATLRAYR